MPTTPTTPSAIRDRIATVIAAITPTSLSSDAFREHREEAPFVEWCETKPASALRRYSVVDTEDDGPPETSSGLEEERVALITVTIAYSKTARYGGDQATDRRRVMREDKLKIEKAIAHLGKPNFTPPTGPDATWLHDRWAVAREEGDACDYMIYTGGYIYVLDVA